MGTNFYLRGHGNDDDPQFHIGKFYAAGLYYWDCKITLYEVHSRQTWYNVCPRCGKSAIEELMEVSAIGRELRFIKSQPQAKKGVTKCFFFTWAMEPEKLFKKSVLRPRQLSLPFLSFKTDLSEYVIEDEYGQSYTLLEFKQIVDKCPRQIKDMIGKRFT